MKNKFQHKAFMGAGINVQKYDQIFVVKKEAV